MKLLIVTGQQSFFDTLKPEFEQEGITVDVAKSIVDGSVKLRTSSYQFIALDQTMLKVNELALIRAWRESGITAQIVTIAVKDTLMEEVYLDSVANNDPHSLSELVLLLEKFRELGWSARRVAVPIISTHDLKIDIAERRVIRAGREIRLTRTEYRLLEYLALHKGQVVTRTMIRERLYGVFNPSFSRVVRNVSDERDHNTSNVVEVYIRYLRNKIDKDFKTPLILTKWGHGYFLKDDPSATLNRQFEVSEDTAVNSSVAS